MDNIFLSVFAFLSTSTPIHTVSEVFTAENIPNFYTAIAEWLACMVFLCITQKKDERLKTYQFILIALGSLAVFILWHQVALLFSINFFWLRMVVAVGIIMLTMHTLGKLSFQEVIFRSMSAFILAEFVAALQWQINYYIIDAIGSILIIDIFCLFIVYVIAFGAFMVVETRYAEKEKNAVYEVKEVIMFVVLAVALFCLSNLSFIFPDTPLTSDNPSIVYYIRTLVDLCGIAFLYSHREHIMSLRSKEEVLAMRSVMDTHYAQYCTSRENMELLKKQIHDFKHHLLVIRNETDQAKKDAYFDELDTSLKTVNTIIETGNNVVDTMLSNKTILCNEKNITFTIVADGTLVAKMEVMDICSIFGNIIDNAIESVDKIEDIDKRVIKLALYSHGNFTMLRVENHIGGNLDYKKGELQTTKKDNGVHGYGLKSIYNIVDKYNGTVKLATKRDWFTIMLLIPNVSDK